MKTNIDNEKIRFEQKELNSHLGSAGAMLAGQSSSEADPENEPFSDSEISEEDFSELLDDVALYTDCLMDLTPALENPAPDILINDKEAIPFESFKASSELAFSFCRRIRDQFPMLDVKLVERLAEANSRRSQRIQARVRDAPKSSNLRKDTVSAASSEPAFSETGPDYSVTTKSSFTPGSLFDEEPPTQKQATDWDDNASQTTFASFSTSFSVEDQFGRPKVPPLPEGAAKGRPFECIACSREIRNVRNRQAWKRHIFNDLQPYACTFMECDQPLILFSSRKRFTEHEKSHEHAETPWTCPFCADENENLPQQAYFKHVARHLREISLAVLPRAADSETESSSSASKEDSEAHSSQGMSQDDNGPVAGVVSDDKPLPSPEPTAKIDTPESHPPVPAAPEHVGEVSQRQLLSEVKPKEPEIQPCNYKTGKTLGAGDTSVIKECINIKTGRYFATKVMNKKSIHDRKDHIRANIAILKMISTTQRKILGFVDYFETLNNLYLVFDLVIGGTLWDRHYQKGDYTEQEGVDVVQQLLQALKYLHDQGIAHNQVKAESVLYKIPHGNEVVLASLGYLQHEGKPIPMKDDSSSDLTPEEVDLPLNGGLSLKSKDMWGLGVLTYFVFCGYSPFDRESAQEETHAIMGGDVDFTHKEHWKNVSTHGMTLVYTSLSLLLISEAMEFIKACLTVNVEKRLNADTALQHSWLDTDKPRPGRELTHHRKTNARKASSSESDERAVIVGDEGVIHRERGQEIFVRFDDNSYNKTRRSSIADHAPHLPSRPADVKGLPSLHSPEPYSRKGKTTMPKRLVSKHAICELGYMYDEEVRVIAWPSCIVS